MGYVAMMGQAAQTGAIAANQRRLRLLWRHQRWRAQRRLQRFSLRGHQQRWRQASQHLVVRQRLDGWIYHGNAGTKIMAVAGAREHGGPVNANSMYRVGEGASLKFSKPAMAAST
ncbi:hypothetical protein [Leclercia adecarboxylata]|uniref:hypothetical protein n=1 Tax=Leclercia adecarboxylata TaxID=83655 RepID=UPI002852EE21|nr:hypothetical protein [Leclercia adecarboxylata]